MSTGPDRGQRLAPGATVPPLATERPKPPPPDHGTPTCWCGSYERGVAEGRRQAAEALRAAADAADEKLSRDWGLPPVQGTRGLALREAARIAEGSTE